MLSQCSGRVPVPEPPTTSIPDSTTLQISVPPVASQRRGCSFRVRRGGSTKKKKKEASRRERVSQSLGCMPGDTRGNGGRAFFLVASVGYVRTAYIIKCDISVDTPALCFFTSRVERLV